MRTYVIYEGPTEVHRSVISDCAEYIANEHHGSNIDEIRLLIMLPADISLADLKPEERNKLMTVMTYKERKMFTKVMRKKYGRRK